MKQKTNPLWVTPIIIPFLDEKKQTRSIPSYSFDITNVKADRIKIAFQQPWRAASFEFTYSFRKHSYSAIAKTGALFNLGIPKKRKSIDPN